MEPLLFRLIAESREAAECTDDFLALDAIEVALVAADEPDRLLSALAVTSGLLIGALAATRGPGVIEKTRACVLPLIELTIREGERRGRPAASTPPILRLVGKQK